MFRVLEWGDAVGRTGLEPAQQPDGYTDYQVDYVRSHGDFWKVDEGCIDDAVAAWSSSAT